MGRSRRLKQELQSIQQVEGAPKIDGPSTRKVVAARHKDPHSNKCNIVIIHLDPETKRNEDVRVVKETGLRSVGESLVGSTPTPRREFG